MAVNWKKTITKCLQSTDYCCIATLKNKSVWSNPVYFAWDEEFNLYFISQMHTRHMQNIKKSGKVAVSIYSTQQKTDVCGVQIEGVAEILTDKHKTQKAFDIYYRRAGKQADVQNYINNPTWIFVKITPKNIYYFDTRYFGEERQLVPMDKLI